MKTLFKMKLKHVSKSKAIWITSSILFLIHLFILSLTFFLSSKLTPNSEEQNEIKKIAASQTLITFNMIFNSVIGLMVISDVFYHIKKEHLEYVVYSKPVSRKDIFWSNILSSLLLASLTSFIISFFMAVTANLLAKYTFVEVLKNFGILLVSGLILELFFIGLCALLSNYMSSGGFLGTFISIMIVLQTIFQIFKSLLSFALGTQGQINHDFDITHNIQNTNNGKIFNDSDTNRGLSSFDKNKGYENSYLLFANIKNKNDVNLFTRNITGFSDFINLSVWNKTFSNHMLNLPELGSEEIINEKKNMYSKKIISLADANILKTQFKTNDKDNLGIYVILDGNSREWFNESIYALINGISISDIKVKRIRFDGQPNNSFIFNFSFDKVNFENIKQDKKDIYILFKQKYEELKHLITQDLINQSSVADSPLSSFQSKIATLDYKKDSSFFETNNSWNNFVSSFVDYDNASPILLKFFEIAKLLFDAGYQETINNNKEKIDKLITVLNENKDATNAKLLEDLKTLNIANILMNNNVENIWKLMYPIKPTLDINKNNLNILTYILQMALFETINTKDVPVIDSLQKSISQYTSNVDSLINSENYYKRLSLNYLSLGTYKIVSNKSLDPKSNANMSSIEVISKTTLDVYPWYIYILIMTLLTSTLMTAGYFKYRKAPFNK
ncbi:hypothetical protein [Mycoplasma sp. Mirounga ES2805-ORL]|uniref:hypothetical protein n=1 Tax=Mycoplasma sp. Mirounga ES2805-ORL TaxID=754514 RepID=UPI00197C5C1E|nr:hypothetical protein [Mycoplasma sp. Mirounga ES2805-ORL]QSF13608.1 hypothetical protein JXZ90_03000 [Mycoplasma sp. Mirounga ES2805-ORL]